MKNVSLSIVLAAAALIIAGLGIVASVPSEAGSVIVSINEFGNLELTPVADTYLAQGLGSVL